MDWLASLQKVSHVMLAMILVAGIIGRWISLRRAQRFDNVEAAARFTEAAQPLERSRPR